MLIGGGSTLPGPRLPRPVAGVRFLATSTACLARYRRRYGDVFAVKVWPFDPLVVVGDPAEVKQIFRGDPAQLHAGEGNRVLEPVVGSRSVLVLDEKEHLRTRKMLLPPFHGERMRVYGDVMRELTESRAGDVARGHRVPAAAGDAAADAADHPAHGLRPRGGGPHGRARAGADPPAGPRRRGSCSSRCCSATTARAARQRRFEQRARRSTRCCWPRSRGAGARPRRTDVLSMLLQADDAADRRGAARPPDHAAAGGPRDDGDHARVDVRAPGAPSGGDGAGLGRR